MSEGASPGGALYRARLLTVIVLPAAVLMALEIVSSRLLAPEFGPVRLHSVGLNHLGFIHRITADGRDVTEPALAWARQHDDGSDSLLTSALRTSARLGAIPVAKYGDLYFHRRHEVAQATAAPRSRAQPVQVMEQRGKRIPVLQGGV